MKLEGLPALLIVFIPAALFWIAALVTLYNATIGKF